MKQMQQTKKTSEFIQQVKNLKEIGQIKAYAEVIGKIDWDKTSLSNVMNGRANVPDYVYAKFLEVYGTSKPDLNNGDIIEGIVKNQAMLEVVLSTLAELLADKRQVPVAKLNADLVSLVNQSIIAKLGKLR